ncbi:hypothetical protein IJ00_26355 (plasmid) [Calothrix sp. 336/3]|nr:hypothetical protein IJ00_26355 [Calothrix sp. 336/3]
MLLEDLTKGATVKGILPNQVVTVVDVKWFGSDVVELTYKDAGGRPGNELLYHCSTRVKRQSRKWHHL